METRNVCNFCKTYETTTDQFELCKCNLIRYCSDSCKKQDYERGHKNICQSDLVKNQLLLRQWFFNNCEKLNEQIWTFVANCSQHVVIKVNPLINHYTFHQGSIELRSVFGTGNLEMYDSCLGNKQFALLIVYDIINEVFDSMIIKAQ